MLLVYRHDKGNEQRSTSGLCGLEEAVQSTSVFALIQRLVGPEAATA
jgi:hypothetical protein